MSRVKKGSELYAAYMKLLDENPELFKKRLDKYGNYLPDEPIWEDTVKATLFYEYTAIDTSFSEHEDLVVEMLESLEPKLRKLLELLFFDRVTVAEASRQMDVSRQTIYTWKAKALELAREFLIERGVGDGED